MLNGPQKGVDEAIDNDASIPTRPAKRGERSRLPVVRRRQNTLKAGKLDFGGRRRFWPPNSLAFAAGGFIKDGAALDTAVEELVELGRPTRIFPKSNSTPRPTRESRSTAQSVPMTDENAKKLFGDTMDVYLGIGPESAYISFGKGSLELVKSIVDKPRREFECGRLFRPSQCRPHASSQVHQFDQPQSGSESRRSNARRHARQGPYSVPRGRDRQRRQRADSARGRRP